MTTKFNDEHLLRALDAMVCEMRIVSAEMKKQNQLLTDILERKEEEEDRGEALQPGKGDSCTSISGQELDQKGYGDER